MKQIRILAGSALLVTAAAALGACRGGNRNTDSAYGGMTTGAMAPATGTTTGTAAPAGGMAGATTGATSSVRPDTSRRDTTTKRP